MTKKIRKPGKRRPSEKVTIDLDRLPLPKVPKDYLSEMFNRLVYRAFEREPPESIEAANAFLKEKFTGRPLEEVMADMELCREDRAQVYAFAAMQAGDADEMILLTMAALRHDPRCVDALSLKTAIDNRSLHGVIADLRKIAAAAENWMGSEFIKENKGEFWNHILTRPYMRLLEQLVSLNLRHGSQAEAIRIMEKMLDLNPNDNQGMRDTLLPIYLKNNLPEPARALIEKYPEPTAIHMYCHVLERFLAGDLSEAHKSLKKARKQNKFVMAYLLDDQDIDLDNLPPYYQLGDDTEAQHCAFEIIPAWYAHPKALEWLREQA